MLNEQQKSQIESISLEYDNAYNILATQERILEEASNAIQKTAETLTKLREKESVAITVIAHELKITEAELRAEILQHFGNLK